MAGINAALQIKNLEPLILKRSDAYIGVLLDDLINKSTDEPYRMFTSRAEYRLLLRQDNADRRLMDYGIRLGLIAQSTAERFRRKQKLIQRGIRFLDEKTIDPAEINPYLESKGTSTIIQKERLSQLLKRPEVNLSELFETESFRGEEFVLALRGIEDGQIENEVIEQIDIETKYDGYIVRQKEQVDKFLRYEEMSIPENFAYEKLNALSTEGKEKLTKIKPISIGQASRIGGVTPADISVLMVRLKS
jgi:tRNA uridine 5-carboxymethylaminomethyl modification enzyme